jgi:hypothetical protein
VRVRVRVRKRARLSFVKFRLSLLSLLCAMRPQWKPTWDMKRSTVLYTCNNTGMHNVKHAIEYGTVVYDW